MLQEDVPGRLGRIYSYPIVGDDGTGGCRNFELFRCKLEDCRERCAFGNAEHFVGQPRVGRQGDLKGNLGHGGAGLSGTRSPGQSVPLPAR